MPLPPTQPLRYDLFMIGSFRRMRAIATLSLILATVVFLLSWHFRAVHPALSYVQAFSEAAMIGGLADWFAIVALFRRPFGLPIPHTAIIPANKARIGRSLGEFLTNYLLDGDSLKGMLRSLDLPRHGGLWLSEEANAAKLVGVAAQALAGASREGILAPWISDLLGQLALFIEGHRADIRDKLTTHSSRWVPEWIDNRLADLVADSLIGLTFEMRAPDHRWRVLLDDWIANLPDQLKRQIGSDPVRLAGMGRQLAEDPVWQETLQGWLETAAVKVLLPRRHLIGDFVAQLVAGWDDQMLVEKLENEVGADLHYIRLNGTLVGGLVGLALYAVTQWLG